MANTEIYQPCGLAEGTVIGDETVVYERDENGNVTGWHKAPVGA